MKKIIAIIILAAMLCLVSCKDTPNETNDNTPNDNVENNDTQNEEQEDNSHFKKVTVYSNEYYQYRAVEQELGCTIIVDEPITIEQESGRWYTFTVETTYALIFNDDVIGVGFGKYRIITNEEYEDIQKYQIETGKQVLYPIVRLLDRPKTAQHARNANIYFVTKDPTSKSIYPKYDENGKFIPNYWKYEQGNLPTLAAEYNSLRIEGEDGIQENGKTYFYAYGRRVDGGIEVRANLHEYQAYQEYVSGNANTN